MGFNLAFKGLNPSATRSKFKISTLGPHYTHLFLLFLIYYANYFPTRIKCLCLKQSKAWV